MEIRNDKSLHQQIVDLVAGHRISEILMALSKVQIFALMQIPDYNARMKAFRKLNASVGRVLRNLSLDKPDRKNK